MNLNSKENGNEAFIPIHSRITKLECTSLVHEAFGIYLGTHVKNVKM